MATRKAKSAKKADAEKTQEVKNYYDAKNGLRIYLRKVDPTQLQMISRTVKLPDQPLYETKTRSGRVEYHLLTRDVAYDEHTPDEDRARYKAWERDYSEKYAQLSEVSIRSIILLGTIVPDDYRDEEWERTARILGMKLPIDDPEEYWVTRLVIQLDSDDQDGLSRAVIAMLGVDEELLAAAEESFSDTLHAQPERSSDVADDGGDEAEDK